MQVRLGDDDRPRLAELFGNIGVLVGLEPLEGEGARGGRHVEGFAVVLEQDGDAVERAGQPVGLEPLVEAVGLLERVGVHEDDRVELGALFVIGLDTGEAALDELAAGEAPVEHRLMDGGDGRLLEHEGFPVVVLASLVGHGAHSFFGSVSM